MSTTPLLALLTTVLLALPAQAAEGQADDGPLFGMIGMIIALIVVATVFALVWRAVSKRRSESRR